MDPTKDLALFVHGFGSSRACWSDLVDLLRQDAEVSARYDLRFWDYPTTWFRLNPLTRLPRLVELGRALGRHLEALSPRPRSLTLIGHSQGGLVLQSYLADVLREGRGADLRPLRQVLLLATPNAGSMTAQGLRRLVAAFLPNPQERALRVLSPEIAELRAFVRDHVVDAERDDGQYRRIPLYAFYGLEDNVVPEASARGPCTSVTPIRGDHFSILHPTGTGDDRFTAIRHRLLEPGGHTHLFEVENFDNVLRVEPRRGEITTRIAGPRRTVRFDNVAHLRRRVRFAGSNRCRLPFTLQYGTRSDGYIEPVTSHPNEASPADLGRWEDRGSFFKFEFTPAAGQTYVLDLTIYKGFDAGARNVHFHLGNHSHYRHLLVELDLTAYLEAGFAPLEPPRLYLHPEDHPHGELCRQRRLRRPWAPVPSTADGVWRWSLEDLDTGIVDLLWNLEATSSLTVDAEPRPLGNLG